MSNMKEKLTIIAILIATLLGCDAPQTTTQEMPEINDVTCSLENLKTIADKAMQQTVASACIRRGGMTTRSPVKHW
jgi:entry exclusion lipoprotein TrbK